MDKANDFHAVDPGSRPAGGGGDRVRYLFSEKRKIPRRKFLATLHFDIVIRNWLPTQGPEAMGTLANSLRLLGYSRFVLGKVG